MLFTGWEVRIGKNFVRGLEYARRVVLKTEGTVCHDTDRPGRPVINIFIFPQENKVQGPVSRPGPLSIFLNVFFTDYTTITDMVLRQYFHRKIRF